MGQYFGRGTEKQLQGLEIPPAGFFFRGQVSDDAQLVMNILLFFGHLTCCQGPKPLLAPSRDRSLC